MARIVAIDWDGVEVRCILASASGDKIKVLAANSAPLVDVAQGGGQSRPDVGGSLGAAMADWRPGRAATIVGLNRASVELWNFTLPPARTGELAQLVHIQAMRESQALDEGATLDFVPLSDNPAEPREVIASVLSAGQRKSIEGACAGAGLRPAHIVLRPLAAASWFLHTVSPQQPFLLVNLVADEADLTVMAEGRVLFLRTVHLPEEVNEYVAAQRLAAEVMRTVTVAQQGPLGGMNVEQICVYGGPGEHQALVEQLEADLGLPVIATDPFETADMSEVELPPSAGRFASLLGMVLDQSRGAHALDFLHPRRPPRPPNRRRIAALAAAAVAAIALALGYYYWELLARASAVNRGLAQEVKTCEENLSAYREQKQMADYVRAWKAGEVVWLDELRDLTLRLPSSRDVVFLRMTMTGGRGGAGAIHVQGLVRDPAVVARIDRSLHDPYHAVASRRVGEQPRGEDYAWLFERSISVLPRPKSQYLTHQPAKP